jgi:DNA-binding response OmpR family regulator
MKETLLIIDDECIVRKILQRFLGTDYAVVAASDGTEAIKWLAAGNKASLIISDLTMPRMDGLELIKRVRSGGTYRDVPIIILSGLDSSSDRISCLELGADDYLVKPFNPQELKLRVRNILKRSRQHNLPAQDHP